MALLFTVPSLALCPQGPTPNITVDSQPQLLSYDAILDFISRLETEDLSKYSEEELNRINHFLAHLARQGLLPGEVEEESILEHDIQELLEEEDHSFEYAYSLADDYAIVSAFAPHQVFPCKNCVNRTCHQTKKFVKKHKKAIIIGAAVVVVATVAAFVVPELIPVIAGGGAAVASEEEEKKVPEVRNVTPDVQQVIAEEIAIFKKAALEQEAKDITFQDKIRDLGSHCAHSTLDAVSSLVSVVPQTMEEMRDAYHRIITPPEGFFLYEDETTPMENYQQMVATCHEQIDALFSTDQAKYHTPESKAAQHKGFVIGILPPPGSASKIAKARELITADASPGVLAEELGFTACEITKFEEAGTLETTVANTCETVVNTEAMVKSLATHKNAREFLKPYAKKPLPESKVREYIHEAGIPTFPRPQGIPEDFLVMISGKGAGMEYVHPENAHIRIRVMPGKPHSPFPYQRKPYVIQQIDGKALTKLGQLVSTDAAEAHIPIEEFVYK